MAQRFPSRWFGQVAAAVMLGLAVPAAAAPLPAPPSAPGGTGVERMAAAERVTGADRVAGIARQLLIASADRCPVQRSDFGFEAVRAGLRPGDLVQTVNGVPWSADRAERARFQQALAAAPLGPQVTLVVQRAGERASFALPGTPRCHADLRVSPQPWINATAIDSTIIIGGGLERLLDDDAELAFAVAHEAAHILLGHTGPDLRAAIGVPAQRRVIEREADALAVRLMAAAGYSASAAPAAWIKIADASRPPLARLMDLHGPYMPTAERAAFLSAEAARAALTPAPHLLAGHLSR